MCRQDVPGNGGWHSHQSTKVNLDLGARASYPSYEGSLNAMPAYLGWCDSAGMKWAGGFLGERKRQGLPYLTALILLIDPRVGNFRAVMEGAFITNYRTGAQTAVALKYLYGRGRKIRLGLYGAGVQGYTQTMAIAELFEITRVQVFDIRRSAAEKYAEDMKNIVQAPLWSLPGPKRQPSMSMWSSASPTPTTVSSATRGLSPGPSFSPWVISGMRRSVHFYGGQNRRRPRGPDPSSRRAGQTGSQRQNNGEEHICHGGRDSRR